MTKQNIKPHLDKRNKDSSSPKSFLVHLPPLSRTPKALKKRVTGGKKRNPLFCPFGKENEKKQDRN